MKAIKCKTLVMQVSTEKGSLVKTLSLKALKYFYENLGRQKFFFQFEIIINVLVSSFRSI